MEMVLIAMHVQCYTTQIHHAESIIAGSLT